MEHHGLIVMGRGPPSRGRAIDKGWIIPISEVEALLGSFGTSAIDVRNYAVVCLAYRTGLKMVDILALERRHYHSGADRLMVPPRKRAPEHEVMLDAATRGALERWMDVRRSLTVRATAPLLCSVTTGSIGKRVLGSYIRGMLSSKAAALGIDRRITIEGLRHSGKQHRQGSGWRMESQIGRYVDEESFRRSYPEVHDKWRVALDLFAIHPQRHASAVGNSCRDALQAFADSMIARRNLTPKSSSGTVDKLRALIKDSTKSSRISAHGEALVAYWGTVSDLANRQAPGGQREKEKLKVEDARRLIFHTMLVMFEVDQLVRESA